MSFGKSEKNSVALLMLSIWSLTYSSVLVWNPPHGKCSCLRERKEPCVLYYILVSGVHLQQVFKYQLKFVPRGLKQNGILEEFLFFLPSLPSWHPPAPSPPISLGRNSTSNEWPVRAACLFAPCKIELAGRLQCWAGNCKPNKAADTHIQSFLGTQNTILSPFWIWFLRNPSEEGLPTNRWHQRAVCFIVGHKRASWSSVKTWVLWSRVWGAESWTVRDMQS